MNYELREKDKKRLANKDWRLNHLYFIKDKNQKLIQFKLNAAQQDFHNNKVKRNIILKSRQLGFTTYETIDAFDEVLFNRNYDALFIAQNLDTAKDIFDNKISLAWQNFRLKDLYIPYLDSARKIKLGFGDNTFSSITVDSSGRSGTYARLHITELALVEKERPDKAKEIILGSIPAVPIDGRIDIESTAQMSEGMFYDMFWEAYERKEIKYSVEFKAHFYNWQWDKEELSKITAERDLPYEFKEYQKQYNLTDVEITYYWLKWISLEKDWNALKKEYPSTPDEAFSGSGNKLFDNEKLGKFIIETGEKVGDWIIYEKYKLGHRYGVGCDVGAGIGQNSSTIVIWDFTPARPKIVAEYASNKIAPDLFAYEIKNKAEEYKLPIIAVERNNHGHTTISKLREIYPERYIYKDDKDRLGWETTMTSKPKMMYDFNTAINEELVDISSRRIISEMRRYDKENLREAKKDIDPDITQHWDLLMATAIGFQMKTELVEETQQTSSYTPNFREFKKVVY